MDRSKLISYLFNHALVRYRAYNEHPYFFYLEGWLLINYYDM